MTTPAPWITDKPPSYRDADPEQNVIVSTHIDNSPDNWALMHWSRAAQGCLPWRHTTTWVPPEPEPPASVIVTPEVEPEAAALRPGDWITDCVPTEADADEDGEVKICTSPGLAMEDWWYEKWDRVTLGWPWRHCKLGDSPAFTPEPTPAAPEPEPEKATRGFLAFTRARCQDGFIDCAIGTDHTAFIRFSAVACLPGDWVPVRPLPQPGEE
jgi:hypothetical protein